VGVGDCVRGGRRVGVHLELFARRRVLLVPAGIGQVRPLRRRGRRLVGRCSAVVRTAEPTGVVEVLRGSSLTLGELFRVWGVPFGPSRLGPFRGRVMGFVSGRRWHAALASIPLQRHGQIVLEVGGYVPPHPRYLFPPGL
jgi:hypothetical protein